MNRPTRNKRGKIIAERVHQRYPKNRSKAIAASREWALKHPERARINQRNAWNRFLLRKYGISMAACELALAAQGYVCAICGCPEKRKRSNRLCVDHDHRRHADGRVRVRGFLCNSCNIGLGLFRDNPTLLRDAAEYLEQMSEGFE